MTEVTLIFTALLFLYIECRLGYLWVYSAWLGTYREIYRR